MSTDIHDNSPTPDQPKSTTTGIAPWMIIVCVLILAGFGAWKMGLLDKLTHRGPLNVNTATIEQLVALPDVNEAIAEDIVKKRPFKTVDELVKVKGIGEKRLAKLRDKVVVADK